MIQYLSGEEAAGERSIVVVMGGAYLLFAMMILLVDETILETGLDEAYQSFNHSAATFLQVRVRVQWLYNSGDLRARFVRSYISPTANVTECSLQTNAGLDSTGPASKLVLKFCLAVWCGLIGALFTFPGMRLARMHWDVLRYSPR